MILGYRNKGKGERISIICHLLVVLFSTIFLISPCVSTAGGLYINEFGTPSMGVAGAGANACGCVRVSVRGRQRRRWCCSSRGA